MQRLWEGRDFWPRFVVLALLFALAAFVVWKIRSVLWLFLVALMITYLLKPWVERLTRARLPGIKLGLARAPSSLAAMLAAGVLLWLLGMALYQPIQVEVVRMLEQFAAFQETDLPAMLDEAQRQWETYRRYVPTPMAEAVESWFTETLAEPDQVRRLLTDWIGRGWEVTVSALELVVELFLLPVLVFYLLSDPGRVQESFLFFVPPARRVFAVRVGRDVGFILEKYIQGQVTLGVIAFVVVAIGLWGMDQFSVYSMPFWLTLGVWAGLTRLVPVVGPLFGSLPIVLFAVFQSFGLAVGLAVALTIIHFIESKYVMPMVIGFKLRMHPILILLSLLVGYQLLGVVGMFLGPPALAIARLLIEYYREAKDVEAAQAHPQPASAG